MQANQAALSFLLGLGTTTDSVLAATSQGNLSKELSLEKSPLPLSTDEDEDGAPPREEIGIVGEEKLAMIAALKSDASKKEEVDSGLFGRDAERDDSFGVFCSNGIAQEGGTCEQACDGKCCVGVDSCSAFTGLLSKDGKTCMGDKACYKATIGCDGM